MSYSHLTIPDEQFSEIQFAYSKKISENDSPTTMHSHDFVELGFIVRGEGTLFFTDKKIPLCEGQLFIINSKTLHKEESSRKNLMTVHYISSSKPLISFANDYLMVDNYRVTADCKELFNSIESELENNAHHWQAKISALISLFYINLCRLFNFNISIDTLKTNNTRLRPIVKYINENYTENINLKELSRINNLSVPHLMRLFKSECQMTPHQYVIKTRLAAAKFMLEYHNFSVSKIAEALHFSDAACFIRAFKANTGCTPKQYLKNQKLLRPV